MQAYNVMHFATMVLPGVVMGLLVGHFLGGWRLARQTRVMVIAFVALIGGLVLALGYRMFIGYESLDLVLAFMSFVGGVAFGAGISWTPELPSAPKRHVLFNPEEDDAEFDRQLQEALGDSNE